MFIRSPLLYPLQTQGKEKLHFISFELVVVLHYLWVLQQAPRAKGADGVSQQTNFEIGKVRMGTMKNTLVLLACMLVLALGASAQDNLNFANLPLVSTPAPMPNG